MPTIYLRKELYDEIIQKGEDVTTYVNEAMEEILDMEEENRGNK